MDPQRFFGTTPWVRRLIVANLLVFLLQKTVIVDPRFQAYLAFDPLIEIVKHTSELQSPVHLVCCLLLEKKKKKKVPPRTQTHIPSHETPANICEQRIP